jgi:hypothetical protein
MAASTAQENTSEALSLDEAVPSFSRPLIQRVQPIKFLIELAKKAEPGEPVATAAQPCRGQFPRYAWTPREFYYAQPSGHNVPPSPACKAVESLHLV